MQENNNITVIPATKPLLIGSDPKGGERPVRVAAYCRVSTGDDEQLTSYIKQKSYYTEMISAKAGWELAGIYADEGISGTSTKHRKEFNRMIRDAKEGHIDLIITKSISRFARNTVDTLNCIQTLRTLKNPVSVIFEKENLNSLDHSNDFVLTILSALAQAESRSISENVRWSIRRNFRSGKPTINPDRMLGYKRGKNGKWLIDKKQAETVCRVFNMYLSGISASRIASLLNENEIYTVTGSRWTAGSVLGILRNEKYVGDIEMQKNVTVDMLSHKTKKNTGEQPKYYIRDHHPAIITRGRWERTQKLLELPKKTAGDQRPRESRTVMSDLICGVCHKPYKRHKYNKKAYSLCDENGDYYFSYALWKCEENGKTREHPEKLRPGEKRCRSPYLYESALQQSFMEELYRIKRDVEENGEDSALHRRFRELCIFEAKKHSPALASELREVQGDIQRMVTALAETRAALALLPDGKEEGDPLPELAGEYESMLSELRDREDQLIGAIADMSPHKGMFDFFVICLGSLPTADLHGERIVPFGSEKAERYTYLRFDRGMYLTFIRSGTIEGDTVRYKTKFGLDIFTSGNSRSLSDFIGAVGRDENGLPLILEDEWQIGGGALQYRKSPRPGCRCQRG